MLKKNLGFYQGLALYLAAVLGTGILVVPLMAWQEAGPASLIAWFVLGFLGLALAWTFASVGAEQPNAGGVQAIIGRVFGVKTESVTRYLVFFSIPAGGVAAAHIFSYHICAAFDLPLSYFPYLAYGSLFIVTSANYFGIELSATAQLILSAVLIFLLLVFVTAASPFVENGNYFPFAPHGILGVGKSAIIVFWSFLGWEAIAHLAEEFKDPNRDMLRAAVAAAIMVGVLYLVVSYVLIGSGATNDSKHMAPLVTFAGKKLGGVGRVFIGVVAGLVCLGTMNAYMAGLSRLGYSMARDGDLPKIFAKIDGKGTPQNSLILQFALNSMALAVQSIFKIELKTFFLIPNLSFLILYILGCVASGKLLKGRPLAVFSAYFSAAVCLVILPFALGVWIVPAIILAAAILRNSLKSKA